MTNQEKPPVTPERIMQFAFAFAPPLMLEAAVRHRVFDALERGPQTLNELASATGTSERGLRALLNALVGLELLTKDAQGRYALTPESAAFLVSGKPAFHGGIFRHISQQMIPGWLELTETVRTGQPSRAVNQEAEGVQFFREFVADLFPINYAGARALAEALHIAQAAQPVSVLDLAAGSGVWGIALAQASPQVQVTAVDFADVLPVTQQMAERFGLADRFRFVGGDLFEVAFGQNYQVATLGHILHGEGEARSRTLLRKTFEALAPGGTIAIAEFLVNEGRTGPPMPLIFAVNMLMHTDQGDTFSFAEIRDWLHEAGFTDARTLDIPAPSPLVLATKPASGS